jgi:hypothetical protein
MKHKNATIAVISASVLTVAAVTATALTVIRKRTYKHDKS